MRGVRANLNTYLAEHQQELEAMRLGLAHSLARYRVKFNPEKIDTVSYAFNCCLVNAHKDYGLTNVHKNIINAHKDLLIGSYLCWDSS